MNCLIVASCAVRSGRIAGEPQLGVSTVVGCLDVFAKITVVAAPHVRRLLTLRRAKQ